jgi:hypothetical protein
MTQKRRFTFQVYLDASDSCAALTFVLSNDNDVTREWTIKTAHIECKNTYKGFILSQFSP